MYRSIVLEKPVRRALLLVGVLVGLVLEAPGGAWALTYSCTTIDYPGQTTRETFLFGINDSEQIVGWYIDNQLQTHSFLYNAGTFSAIDYPGVTYTFAEGINNSGQIIGHYLTSTHIYGFLDTGGNFSTLSYPNALTTNAFGISNYGQIVGNYLIDNSSNIHGFVYNNGNFVSVDYPGAADTDLTGINDFGQMVGYYDMNGRHSFLYNAGNFSSFDDPRGVGTTALGINNQGYIVGYSSSGSFLRDSTGTFSSIVCPGAISPTHARGINNKGQIVGEYYVNGLAHGVLATPVPTVRKCPLDQGFWQANPGAWPVTSLTLGSQTYTQAELLALFNIPPRGDASLILAHQLIAAKLNIVNGSDPTPVSATITDADSLLSQFPGKLPYNVRTSAAVGRQMVNDANVLDRYNNGDLTPDCQP